MSAEDNVRGGSTVFILKGLHKGVRNSLKPEEQSLEESSSAEENQNIIAQATITKTVIAYSRTHGKDEESTEVLLSALDNKIKEKEIASSKDPDTLGYISRANTLIGEVKALLPLDKELSGKISKYANTASESRRSPEKSIKDVSIFLKEVRDLQTQQGDFNKNIGRKRAEISELLEWFNKKSPTIKPKK